MKDLHPETPKKAKILLVDDHPMVRYGMAQLIDKQKDLAVCGEAEDVAEAMEAVAKLQPDLVIVDLSLKDSSGLHLIKNLKALNPDLPLLVVSMHDEAIYGEMALRAGASGYMMKEVAMGQVLTAIRQVLAGELFMSSALAAKMLQQQFRGDKTHADSPLKRLSDREMEVFQLIGQWKGTRQIAEELHLSIKTVEYYRDQIKRKLNLKNASELVQYSVQWAQGTDVSK